MCKQPDILESEKIHFAVMAIEAGAREMGISPMEMRRRLEKMNLIKRLLGFHNVVENKNKITYEGL